MRYCQICLIQVNQCSARSGDVLTHLQLLGVLCRHSSRSSYSSTLWSQRGPFKGQAAYSEHWFKSGPSLAWPKVPSICCFVSVTSDIVIGDCVHACNDLLTVTLLGTLTWRKMWTWNSFCLQQSWSVCWGKLSTPVLSCLMLQGALRLVNLRKELTF